jgi:phage gpG-like protein
MAVKVTWHGEKFQAEIERALALGVRDGGEFYAHKVREALNKRASNKESGGSPSPPGQPPAKMTGALGRSITVDTVRRLGKTFRTFVGTNLKYARIHEFGGIIRPKKKKALRFKIGDKWVMVKRVVMPKRPYFRPTLAANRKKIRDRMLRPIAGVVLRYTAGLR